MRITLMHNPKAGQGDHDADALVELLEGAGYKVDYQSTKKKKWKKALKEPGELVVVAGGDGTVGKVIRELAGRDIPVAILPLGTANNLATSLGIEGEVEELVAGWERADRLRLDVGVATGPWGESRFLEAVGLGLFPQTMAVADSREEHDEPEDREEELRRSLRFLEMSLASARTRHCEIRLDDEDLSGDFFLVEAMNVSHVGPNLRLAPEARTDDGRLEVVCVREDDRDRFVDYLERRIAGEDVGVTLPVRHGRRVVIRWDGAPLHIDDVVHADGAERDGENDSMTVTVELNSHVEVLVRGS